MSEETVLNECSTEHETKGNTPIEEGNNPSPPPPVTETEPVESDPKCAIDMHQDQDVSGVKPAAECENVEIDQKPVEEDDDDDFDDFQFASFATSTTTNATDGPDPAPVSSQTEPATSVVSEDNWAAFGQSACTSAFGTTDNEGELSERDHNQMDSGGWTTTTTDDDWASAGVANTQSHDQQLHMQQRAHFSDVALSPLAKAFEDNVDMFTVDAEETDSDVVNTSDQTQIDLLSVICELKFRNRQRAVSTTTSGQIDNGNTEEMKLSSAADLWRRLRLVDEALSLKFSWDSSATCRLLLHCLNMDVKIAQLSRSSLPAFAPHLNNSVLVPQPASQKTPNSNPNVPTATSASTKTNAIIESPKTSFSSKMSANETLNEDCAVPKSLNNNNDGSVKMSTPNPNSPINSLAVPPVQFDWQKSGLSNPLTGQSVSQASAMLDLDFLTANDSKSVPGSSLTAALQRDLDALGLTNSSSSTPDRAQSPHTINQPMTQSHQNLHQSLHNEAQALANGQPPAPVPVCGTNGLSISGKMNSAANLRSNLSSSSNSIDKNSANNKSARHQPILNVSDLSTEARDLHDRIPNLEYMLANNLVFPITGANTQAEQ